MEATEITLELALQLNLTTKERSTLSKDEQYSSPRVEKLSALTTLHLEWSNIREIDNLELFAGLETLYLQYVGPT